MHSFDPSTYGSAIADLVERAEPPELGPGTPHRQAEPRLQNATVENLFAGRKVVDRDMARCCLAGLWLRHDFLDESHQISQEIPSSTGSYWHGIMHRREPDYENAKYWFRKVGKHPIYAPLLEEVRSWSDERFAPSGLNTLLVKTDWDPFVFVDLCEQAARTTGSQLANSCRRIALVEWQLLFDYSFRAAVGSPG